MVERIIDPAAIAAARGVGQPSIAQRDADARRAAREKTTPPAQPPASGQGKKK